MAFPYDRKAVDYEPTRIEFSPEYTFLENVFSPLFEFNSKNGDVVAGIADDFQWHGEELSFHIRKGLKTIDGDPITAEDAALSFKRLLVLSGNTHGNFSDLICDGKKLKALSDECSGIRVDGESVVLRTSGMKPFLIPMLAAADFAIVPSKSFDHNTLKITDFRNTSGPFYVSSDDGHGQITLKANPSHYHYSKEMAQTVLMIPSGLKQGEDSRDLYKQNKIDLITTIDKLNHEKVIDFAKSERMNLHTTMNLRTFVLVFTSRGLRRFSEEERIAIGKTVRYVFREGTAGRAGYEFSEQLFPSYGGGALNPQELAKLTQRFESVGAASKIKKSTMTLLRMGQLVDFKGQLETRLQGLSVMESTQIPALTKYANENDMPDMFVCGPDNGYLEAIDLISYSMNIGLFGIEKNDGEKWLADYMKIESKKVRLERLRELHFQTLLSGRTIPMLSVPYVAAARPPWQIKYSQIYSNDWLWRITRE